MKVLYITYQAVMYGANTSLFYLMKDMRERYNVTPVLLVSEEGPLVELCQQEGIKVYCSPFYRWLTIGNSSLAHAKSIYKNILNSRNYRLVLSKLKDEQFDLVHTNSTITDIGDVIASYFGVPHIWHLREYGIDDYNMFFSHSNRYVRKRFNRSEHIVAISESIKECYVQERKICDNSKVTVIYNGVDIPEKYTKNWYNKTRKLNICMSGMISSNKNQIMAIEACNRLKITTDNFTLHIIGDGVTPYVDELKEKVRQYNLENHVEFWGYRKDVIEILKQMDLGLMLSKKEAFGRVTVEFMLNYMPVIGADSGGTTELIQSGENGFLCGLDDVTSLVQSLSEFEKNPMLIRTMGENARKIAESKYGKEINTDNIYKLYC